MKKYIPDAPAAWDKITIYNLLTHTSGIPDYTSFPDFWQNELSRTIATTPEKLIERFRDKPLDFQPGENWGYSNSGYDLLGYLIEKISGESYGDFVQENIFTPLGMKDSGYNSNSADISNLASGYAPGPGGLQPARYVDPTVLFSAGGLYSTTHDLLRWEDALFGGKVLSAASLKKMTTPYQAHFGLMYACGLQVQTVNGHTVISHGGFGFGISTMLAYYPEDKLTIVVLGNVGTFAPPNWIRWKLTAVLLGKTFALLGVVEQATYNIFYVAVPDGVKDFFHRHQISTVVPTPATG